MLTPRKLLATAVASVAVAALIVSSASAYSVVNEATGTACSSPAEAVWIMDGCPIGAGATDLELGGPFGVMVECDMTLEGRAGGNGRFIFSYSGVSCEENQAHPCVFPEAHNSVTLWPGYVGPTYGFTANFCFDVETPLNLGEVHCDLVTGTLNELAGHNYSLSFSHSNKCTNSAAYSIQGTITLVVDAAHPRIELRN